MARIVLINIGDGRKYPQIDRGLGLASAGLEWIATYLTQPQHNITVKIIDQSLLGLSNNEVIKQVLACKADIIGYNPLSNTRESFQKIVLKIKEHLPNAINVIGGYDATFRLLKHYQGIDLIVRGRGEKAMLTIAQYFDATKQFSNIQGIAYRRQDGETIENLEQRTESIPLENLPIPKRPNVEYLLQHQEPVSIVSSIGCDFKCKFCSTPRMYPEGRRERPTADVLAEIDYLATLGLKKYSFWDEDFFGVKRKSMERAAKIINHIKELGATITFAFISTPGVNLAEQWGYLKQLPQVAERLYIGIEGGCKHALEAIGNLSCLSPNKNTEAIKNVRRYNIGLQIGFMMFNPHSTWQEIEESAQFLYDNDEASTAISFFHHLRPYPGTPVYDNLKVNGLLEQREAEGEIDRYVGFPYQFRQDIETRESTLKRFAIEMGVLSGDALVGETDRTNNEVYIAIVKQGYGREIFSRQQLHVPSYVKYYRKLREDLAKVNFYFFKASLKSFRDNDGIDYESLKIKYLNDLSDILAKLKGIFS